MCGDQSLSPCTDAVQRAWEINDKLEDTGLFGSPKREVALQQNATWRISPEPFYLDKKTYRTLEKLGPVLAQFYTGIQRLYELSLRGHEPAWIAEYLELGKNELVKDYGRMRRFRQHLPGIIRPDIILTDDGFVATELDSVPGGFGLLGAISRTYSDLGYNLIGGHDGMVDGFARMICSLSSKPNPTVAIVVSDESRDYLGEMIWLSQALQEKGMDFSTVSPEELTFQEDGLYITRQGNLQKIDILYRFFELFDLKNIPKIDLILYAIRKQLVVVTPPLKSHLEEKLNFALFHHPALESFWRGHLGDTSFEFLRAILPHTWVVDSRPMPPHGVIPGLTVGNKPVTDWRQLKAATQTERQLVLKVSGFSEKAWGSRGVHIGHDMSQKAWGEAIDDALESFATSPYILQEFHKGRQVKARYLNFESGKLVEMPGRVRLCPYYFVTGTKIELAGILATICPLNKKIIHGMVDAIMVPTAVR